MYYLGFTPNETNRTGSGFKSSPMKPSIIRQGNKLTPARLAKVEKQFGIRLPKEYRAFMLANNGGEPEPSGVCRKRSKAPSLSCSYFFSIDAERSYEDWVSAYEGMKNSVEVVLPKRIVPIGDDSGGNVFCISVSGKDEGKIYWWFHEHAFVPDPPRRVVPDMTGITLVADSFEAFLNQFAEDPDEHPEIKTSDWVALVKKRDLKGVAAWLDKGGKWDQGDPKEGRIPLTMAIALGEWPILKLLLDRGADWQVALQHSIQVNAWSIVRRLLERLKPGTVTIDSSMFAGAFEDCEDVVIIKSLVALGAPIHGEHFGRNPLFSATLFKGNPTIVKLLLDCGARLDQSGDDQSPLANAIANGQLATAKLLLDAGEDLYKDPQKKTRKELKLEAQIKEEQRKTKPNKIVIENCLYMIEHERKVNRPRAPICSFEHPARRLSANFKSDVIAYAAKLGQKPLAI
jgi:ankyrin repeat protein